MARHRCASCGKFFMGDGRRRYCDDHQPPKRTRGRGRSQHLHAIRPGEVPPTTPAPKTIEEAARAGSTLDELRLIRVRIARTLDNPNCPPKDISSLSRRQLEIAKEIDALTRQREESDGGDLSVDEAWSEEAI